MKNNLNALDKYLGERVEITGINGKKIFLKVTACGLEFISGFDDERENYTIYMGNIKNIEVVKK